MEEKNCEKETIHLHVGESAILELIRRYRRQIPRLRTQIEKLEAREENLSVYGHRDLGYFRGRLSAMEDIVDDLRNLIETTEERWGDVFEDV